MAAPVTPAQFLASIPSVGDDMCTRIKKSLIDGPTDFYELVNWMFNSDGTISPEFAEALCTELQALGCVSAGTSTTTTNSTTTGTSESFTTPGTYNRTVPDGVTTMTAQAWGAGGGGGGHTVSPWTPAGYWAASGGGGGGEYRTLVAEPVTPGQAYVVVVGSGGTYSSYASGGAGSDSGVTIAAVVKLQAIGGSGGVYGGGINGGAINPGAGGSGGTGGVGTTNAAGSAGTAATATSNADATGGYGGNAGDGGSVIGKGGRGGGNASGVGAVGAAGKVIVTFS